MGEQADSSERRREPGRVAWLPMELGKSIFRTGACPTCLPASANVMLATYTMRSSCCPVHVVYSCRRYADEGGILPGKPGFRASQRELVPPVPAGAGAHSQARLLQPPHGGRCGRLFPHSGRGTLAPGKARRLLTSRPWLGNGHLHRHTTRSPSPSPGLWCPAVTEVHTYNQNYPVTLTHQDTTFLAAPAVSILHAPTPHISSAQLDLGTLLGHVPRGYLRDAPRRKCEYLQIQIQIQIPDASRSAAQR